MAVTDASKNLKGIGLGLAHAFWFQRVQSLVAWLGHLGRAWQQELGEPGRGCVLILGEQKECVKRGSRSQEYPSSQLPDIAAYNSVDVESIDWVRPSM